MLRDRFDNEISTESAAAGDRYVLATDQLLAGEPDMVPQFEAVVAADPGFALGHSGLARARMISSDPAGARSAAAEAEALAESLPAREASHVAALSLLIKGKTAEAYRAARAHVADYPRDVLVAQTCTSVYGLIGFSGQPGREAELLAYTSTLQPHYGEDWWFLSQHAFSLCETGQIARAEAAIERSLTQRPRNAHGAHVRSHVFYEAGEHDAGAAWLADWLRDCDRGAIMHGHLSWHGALWALEAGNLDRVWASLDADVAPGGAEGPPLIVMTDTASLLYRIELAGETVPPERWQAVSGYAKRFFPKPGLGWADVHAALAHAMAGDSEALEGIAAHPVGPAADLVRAFAEAFRAIAAQDWPEASGHLIAALADHARIGGSRAQRDLLEFSLLNVLLKEGKAEEARRLLALHRPALADRRTVKGL
ncbi:MAG: tetratricopeptide repeat protein [Rhodospirillales bacterium]